VATSSPHPVVEPGELGAVMRPPPPLVEHRKHPARDLARRPSFPGMRNWAEPATRYLERDYSHLSSPNLVERCECARQNHLFVEVAALRKSTNETFAATT
jgi:hypothetical protein